MTRKTSMKGRRLLAGPVAGFMPTLTGYSEFWKSVSSHRLARGGRAGLNRLVQRGFYGVQRCRHCAGKRRDGKRYTGQRIDQCRDLFCGRRRPDDKARRRLLRHSRLQNSEAGSLPTVLFTKLGRQCRADAKSAP